MKNNAVKGFIKRNRIFSKLLITAFLISIMLLTLLTLPISANLDMRVENYNNCEKYLQKLNEEINNYSALDKETGKPTSSTTTQIISKYKDEILALQMHPEIEQRSLESEILLSYAKGLVGGRLAWQTKNRPKT